MKLIISFLLSINILIASESNIVKTSELELFLFKVGFESLLKDVDITKHKSNLNESEVEKLNSKIEIIMEELYKDKRVLRDDSKNIGITYNIDEDVKKEISILKDEVSLLKNQINKLLLNKKPDVKKVVLNIQEYKIKVNSANIRARAFPSSEIIEILPKGTLVSVEYCNKFGWCKLKNEKKFVSRFLLEK